MANTESRREKILQKMIVSPTVTYEELVDCFGVARRTIARDIELLTKQGKLHREGGDFGGKWVVTKDNV